MTLGLWIRRVGHLVRVLGCGDFRVMSGGDCEEGGVGKIGLAVAAQAVEGLVLAWVVGVHVWDWFGGVGIFQ
jgi:hypothetical protein